MATSTTTIVTSNSVEGIISTSPSVTSKVDKVDGKQLSSEDYTNAEKTKLSGVEDGAQVNVVKSVTVNGSGNVVSNAVFNNGALTLSKSTLTVPSEATEQEITTGTATDKYISPNRNKNAVKTAIIKNADDRSLDSANQSKVQEWLGINTLTFTFNDNTTKTFNFVSNKVESNS